jgi:hypothetical protein
MTIVQPYKLLNSLVKSMLLKKNILQNLHYLGE